MTATTVTIPTAAILPPEARTTLTPQQLERWETHVHPNCAQSRHDRIWKENGEPKLDHYGRPRSEYVTKIEAMTLEQLQAETYQMIYHSARCAGNRVPPDWDWMCDCCYDELFRRTYTADAYAAIYARFSADYS